MCQNILPVRNFWHDNYAFDLNKMWQNITNYQSGNTNWYVFFDLEKTESLSPGDGCVLLIKNIKIKNA